MLAWRDDNSSHTDSIGPITYSQANYFRPSGHEKGIMELGIQRKLLEGRVIWFVTKDNHVGIYEKAEPWYDESGAFSYSGFESVLKDREDGDEFHLVQVVEEHTPVYTVALSNSPVYIKGADGKEIKGCCTRPPQDSTAHLRSPLEYPKNLKMFALGFSSEQSNVKASLYEPLGDDLKYYHPRLLLNQQDPITPHRKEWLYPDEHPSFRQQLHYGALAAQVWFDTKRGRREPVGNLPLE